jgi:hypothetical protein
MSSESMETWVPSESFWNDEENSAWSSLSVSISEESSSLRKIGKGSSSFNKFSRQEECKLIQFEDGPVDKPTSGAESNLNQEGKSGDVRRSESEPVCDTVPAQAAEKGAETITAAQFEECFGEDVAKYLSKIGCTKVKVEGNTVALELEDDYVYEIRDGKRNFKNVKLSDEISFAFEETDKGIRLKDIEGVRLNPYIGPEFGAPDVTISEDGIDLGEFIPNIPAEGLYEELSKIVSALKKRPS